MLFDRSLLCLSDAYIVFFTMSLIEATEPEKMDTDTDSQQADKVRFPLIFDVFLF